MSTEKYSGFEAQTSRQEFDINASIRRLQNCSVITPELKRSILADELSYVEEGIGAPQIRPYELYYTGEALIDEAGRSVAEMMQNGIDWAATELTKRKAVADQKEYEQSFKMMGGELGCNTLISFRPFPEEYSDILSEDKLNEVGIQPKRRLGSAIVYHKQGEVLSVNCLSLDNTRTDIIRRIALGFGQPIPDNVLSDEFQAYPIQLTSLDAEGLTSYIVGLYDGLLESETGLKHHQGRLGNSQTEIRQFLQKQPELVEFYWQELVKLSEIQLDEADLTTAKKRITYSFWARAKERYNHPESFNTDNRENLAFNIYDPEFYFRLEREVIDAGRRAAARFDVLVGCPGATTPSELFNLDASSAANFIFGDQETDNIPSLIKCINPNCRKLVKKEKVIKTDCWICPECGTKAVCGKVIYANNHKTKTTAHAKSSKVA